MSKNYRPFIVKHGYCNSSVSKYLFRSVYYPEALYRPSSGIIHLLSRVTSSWTLFHEAKGHNMLLTYNPFSFYLSTIKHELLLKLMSICKESYDRIELPLPKGDWSFKDIRAEGAVEAISRLDRFCECFNKNSILTHEGYSDKIADYETNINSMGIFESEKENNPDLDYHITGMKIAEKIEEKYGGYYLGWAACAALNTEFINPLNPEIKLDSYFTDNMNQPDARFKMLASSHKVPKPFPTDSPTHHKEFMELAQELLPNVYVTSIPDLVENDSDLIDRWRKFRLLPLEIIYSVPYLGADWNFVKSVDSKIWEDLDIWKGSISRLRSMVDYRKGKDFRVAWKNWQRFLSARELSKVLKKPDILPEIFKDKLYYGIGLAGEFFRYNPPLVVRDSGNESVDLLIRPDIKKDDKKRLLLKDFLESLSAVLLGKSLVSESDFLQIPCYMGVEDSLDCNPQASCLAKHMLENFEPRKTLILMCRSHNKTITIRGTSN